MFAISTVAFVSVLAFASSLAVVVQAAGPRAQCRETGDVKKGDTCASLGARYSLSEEEILSMNPGITCDGTFPGSRLCLQLMRASCTGYQTATAISCKGLLAGWGLTLIQFVDYNDDVNDDCSNLVQVQSYCVSV